MAARPGGGAGTGGIAVPCATCLPQASDTSASPPRRASRSTLTPAGAARCGNALGRPSTRRSRATPSRMPAPASSVHRSVKKPIREGKMNRIERIIDRASPTLSVRLRYLKSRARGEEGLRLLPRLAASGDHVVDIGAYRGARDVQACATRRPAWSRARIRTCPPGSAHGLRQSVATLRTSRLSRCAVRFSRREALEHPAVRRSSRLGKRTPHQSRLSSPHQQRRHEPATGCTRHPRAKRGAHRHPPSVTSRAM